VKFKGSPDKLMLQVSKIDDIDYFKLRELTNIFGGSYREELNDDKLRLSLYKKHLYFMLESSYVNFRTDYYSYIYNLKCVDGHYYLPTTFLEIVAPLIFEKEIRYDAKRNLILAEIPDDDAIRTIVLDAGHGGKDPGAVGYSKKNQEKDITLTLVKQLKKMLEDNLDVQVLLTRSKDEYVHLRKRTKFANQQHADMFISIHLNSAKNKKATGIEVYYLSTAKTDEARAVEQMENSVVFKYEGGEEAIKEYDSLDFLLADISMTEQLAESSDLANKLQTNLITATRTEDRGVKQAGFYVLKGAYMPSVLIEVGFISNKTEEKQLADKKHQKKIVKAIFYGIKSFKYQVDNI
jgi:N-acetylmuramoyl-L-alanine amidase